MPSPIDIGRRQRNYNKQGALALSNKRNVLLICLLALVAGAVIGGLLAASRIQSPADAAARTASPTPSPILVPVEKRVLSSDIVTRGTARFGLPQSISVVPSVVKGKAGLITTIPLRNIQFAVTLALWLALLNR